MTMLLVVTRAGGYTKLNEPSVCHKLLSTLCLLVQVCSRTEECQVCRGAPIYLDISERSVSIHPTILRLIQIILP